MKDRGMMKWAPYKSLDQQADYLAKMAYEKGKKEKPTLSSEEAEEINDLLVHYHDELVKVHYFQNGYVHEETGLLDEINTIYKFLKINDLRISFKDIVSLKEAIF
jgi:hypothetical protein